MKPFLCSLRRKSHPSAKPPPSSRTQIKPSSSLATIISVTIYPAIRLPAPGCKQGWGGVRIPSLWQTRKEATGCSGSTDEGVSEWVLLPPVPRGRHRGDPSETWAGQTFEGFSRTGHEALAPASPEFLLTTPIECVSITRKSHNNTCLL